jgi:hypothetical protein
MLAFFGALYLVPRFVIKEHCPRSSLRKSLSQSLSAHTLNLSSETTSTNVFFGVHGVAKFGKF